MKFSYSLLTAGLALTGLLSACGGGGGGSAATSVAPPVALTSTNMNTAAQDTAAAAYMPIGSSQTLTGAQVADESVLFTIAREQLDKLPVYIADAKGSSSLVGVVSSSTVNCSTSGTLTVSVNVANSNGVPSPGDSVSITSNSCNFGSGPMSGSLTFTINALSGTYPTAPYNASFTMAFNNFTVTGPQLTAGANGSLTLALNVTGANAFTSTLSTPSLSVSGTYGALTRTRTLSSYSATLTRVPVATSYQTSHTINGTVTSSALNSLSISFATTTPFVVQGLDHYPSTGIMVITGASGSKLRITAVTNATATEELDANGDGTYEVGPVSVAWNTLY